VTLKNLYIENGIDLWGVEGCVLVNNSVSKKGIYLENANNCIIANNTIINSSSFGIHVETCDLYMSWYEKDGFNNLLTGNIVSNNQDGIRVSGFNSLIAGNIVTDNGDGITTNGYNITLIDNIITNNSEAGIDQTEMEEDILVLDHRIDTGYTDLIETANKRGLNTQRIEKLWLDLILTDVDIIEGIPKVRLTRSNGLTVWIEVQKILQAIEWASTNLDLFIDAEEALRWAEEGNVDTEILTAMRQNYDRVYISLGMGNVEGASLMISFILNTREKGLSNLFTSASEAINNAEEERHPAILAGMKTNYEYAQSKLHTGDYQRTEAYLNSIIYSYLLYFEMEDLVNAAREAIVLAGNRYPALYPAIQTGMKNNLCYAYTSLGLGNRERATVYLNSIIEVFNRYFRNINSTPDIPSLQDIIFRIDGGN
jgi:parallel beta-helix repeat protein